MIDFLESDEFKGRMNSFYLSEYYPDKVTSYLIEKIKARDKQMRKIGFEAAREDYENKVACIDNVKKYYQFEDFEKSLGEKE